VQLGLFAPQRDPVLIGWRGSTDPSGAARGLNLLAKWQMPRPGIKIRRLPDLVNKIAAGEVSSARPPR
jgi:hypothetical protein